MTKYAKMILEIIEQSHEHMSAEQIFFKLKERESKAVLATVYNNLNKLYQDDKIRKITMEGSPDRYDKKIKHDHLVCRSCGQLSDMCFEDLTQSLEQQLGEGILSYDLKVFYLCPKCQEKYGNSLSLKDK